MRERLSCLVINKNEVVTPLNSTPRDWYGCSVHKIGSCHPCDSNTGRCIPTSAWDVRWVDGFPVLGSIPAEVVTVCERATPYVTLFFLALREGWLSISSCGDVDWERCKARSNVHTQERIVRPRDSQQGRLKQSSHWRLVYGIMYKKLNECTKRV